jgi:hypothetical protein
MKSTPRPIDVLHAVFGLLLCIVGTSATAGETLPPISTNATIGFACMASGGRFEYDSAAFAVKNPGPNYSDLDKLVQRMDSAFKAWLQQKYDFQGYAQCGQYDTLAEAKKWLEWRKSESEQPGKNYQLVRTDWTFSGGSDAAAPAVTPATPAAQSAAVATGSSTGYWACASVANGVRYESAVFAGPNDSMRQRRAFFGFRAFMAERHPALPSQGTCDWRPTRAAAEAWLSQFGAGINGGVTESVPTGWSPDNGPTATAPSQTTTTHVATATPAPKPAAPPVMAPKPSVAPNPSAPATSVAPKGTFVVCNAVNLGSMQRLYNPPLQVESGDYPDWMASYKRFVQTNYKFDRGVRCSKFPTLTAAQSYYKEITDTAKLTTEFNGKPAPLIITNWKYP